MVENLHPIAFLFTLVCCMLPLIDIKCDSGQTSTYSAAQMALGGGTVDANSSTAESELMSSDHQK